MRKRENRETIYGIDLARDVVEAVYTAYLSAERGIRVETLK